MKRIYFFIVIMFNAVIIAPAQSLANIQNNPLALLAGSTTIAGPEITSADVESKPVVITFFASWCPPCTHEFKQLNALQKHPDAQNTKIIAINVFEEEFGNNPARMKRFLARTQPKFTVLKGTDKMRSAFGDITRIPTLIVYDKKGRESWRFIHKQGATKMSADMDEILKALQSASN